MRQLLKSERGLTVIEVIVALSLLMIIFLVIGTVHLFGQRQFDQQANHVDIQSNMRVASKWISTDARKSANFEFNHCGQLTFISPNIKYTYHAEDQTILRDGAVIAEKIASFCPDFSEQNPNEQKFTVIIKSTEDADYEFKKKVFIRD